MSLIDRVKAEVPMFNSPHPCPMCGGRTTWEARQKMAENMRIHGLTIVKLKEAVEFAKSRGWQNNV